MTRRARLAAAAMLVAVMAGGVAVYRGWPFRPLDWADRIQSIGQGTARIGQDIAFRPGPRGKLDIWAGRSTEAKRPVVIFFYGGGWLGGRRQDYAFAGRAYASKGFVAVVPDYRLVPEVRFPGFIEDAAAAVRWTRDNIARFGGDPTRITLAGHSAGAYLAVMLALDRRYLDAVGVDPRTVRAVAALAGPYDFYPFGSFFAQQAMGYAPDPLATQPIRFARADAPPMWLATGTHDETVRAQNARRLAAKEAELGNRTTVLREYAGLDHVDIVMALAQPFRSKAPVLDESAAFLTAHARP